MDFKHKRNIGLIEIKKLEDTYGIEEESYLGIYL